MNTMRALARASVLRTAAVARPQKRVLVGRGFRLRGGARIDVHDNGHLLLGVVPFGFADSRMRALVRVDGALEARGRVSIGMGARWHVAQGGRVTIGDHTYFSPRTLLLARNRISIGAGCAVAWDTQILDDDFHPLVVDGAQRPRTAEVVIGDRVWIGARATVLKGSRVADDCVVASGSIVTGTFDEPGCLLAGSPARVVRTNVSWSR